MSIRTKLLICFLCLSMFTFIVGMVFYVQLKSLIEPLTPQSIPQSVDNLAKVIESNSAIAQIEYQQLLVDYNLQDYVYTHRHSSLQNYYLNEAILANLIESAKRIDMPLWKDLRFKFEVIEQWQEKIIKQMQQNNYNEAALLLTNSEYPIISQRLRNALYRFSHQTNQATAEESTVTVKLAAKNASHIVLNSLNTSIVIFLDAIIMSLLFAFYSARAISKPINLLRDNFELISRYTLDTPINPDLLKIKGELGDLTRSFIELINKLRNTTVLRDELLIEIERRKKTEEDLRKTAIYLEASNRELDQFAYAASHDLKAPLRAIANLADWIEEDCAAILPVNSKNHLELIKKRIKRLESLIEGILDYSRVGKVNTDIKDVNTKDVLAEVIDNLSPPSNITVNVANNLPVIKANRYSIMQVFLNLIHNAIKYNDKTDGIIDIGCAPYSEYYQFSVKDNGPGIDPAYHDRIFTIFQTLHSRDVIEGTGIGLAIVKKIIEQQGGAIWVESTLNKGATFYFTWPKTPIIRGLTYLEPQPPTNRST